MPRIGHLPAIACAIALASIAIPAAAQKMRPGLWEHAVTIKGSGEAGDAMARMRQEMASMPPEQRQQVEAMMAQRGMGMGAGGAATSVRICITAEQAARDEPAMQDQHCKRTSSSRSGSTVKFSFACEGPRPSKGEGEFTLVSDREQKGKVTITRARDNGQIETVETQTSARWLGADCGDVKSRP